jgi:PAS domain S-box-containing protein
MRARSLALAGIGAVALLATAGAIWLVARSHHTENKWAIAALALTAGLAFVVSGLAASWRRPDNRTGLLLLATGFLWLLGALTAANEPWAFTLGWIVNSTAFGAFGHLILAYPSGRLDSRFLRRLVAAIWFVVIAPAIALVLVGGTDEVCGTACPDSTLTVWANDDAARAIVTGTSIGALAVVAIVLYVLARRWQEASVALRRILLPVFGASALSLVLLVSSLVVGEFSTDASRPLELLALAAFAAVPLSFFAGILRSRLARSAVADLLLALNRGASLRRALAQALHDPSLEVVFWLPERQVYVWHDGNEFHDEGGPRIARYVERHGQPVAAILHDPSFADDPELVDAVAEAAGLWLENERLQAELRAQYDYLETIVNTAPSLLMSLDIEGRLVNYNSACDTAAGIDDHEEIRGSYFWDVFIAPEDRELVRERFLANPAPTPEIYENAFVNRRGEELVIAWSTAPLFDASGKLLNVICAGLDVTERKLREVELARERDFLRTLADGTPSLLVVVDDEGTVVGNAVNKSFERTIGLTEEEMLGRSFLTLFRDDEGYAARLGVASAFNGVASAERVSHWRTVAGGERSISWTATPIVDGEGRSLALIVGVDVTERELRDAELRSSEERLRATIEASPVAVLEVGLDDRIALWNPAAERMFGWTAEEMLGGGLLHIPGDEQERLAALMTRVRSGEIYTGVEAKRLRKDGTLIDVEISAAPILDAEGKVVSHIALFSDISERKRQEEEVRASRARIVAAADDARRVLERNLHDGAQQRLVALSLSLRLAQGRISADPGAAETILESAREELALAIEDLRELARGIHPAVLTDRGLEAAVETLAGRSPVPVEVSVPAERLPGPVEAAAYYVVAEALTNVAKYAQASAAHVRVSRDNGRALVEVSDDGIGGADAGGGSGLRGLADRVAALDGTLEVESPPGGGTRIRADLPVPEE